MNTCMTKLKTTCSPKPKKPLASILMWLPKTSTLRNRFRYLGTTRTDCEIRRFLAKCGNARSASAGYRLRICHAASTTKSFRTKHLPLLSAFVLCHRYDKPHSSARTLLYEEQAKASAFAKEQGTHEKATQYGEVKAFDTHAVSFLLGAFPRAAMFAVLLQRRGAL